MDPLVSFSYHYQLLILILTPFALFALWITWLESERPKIYLRLATVTVILYVGSAIAVTVSSLVSHTFSAKMFWHLLGPVAAVILWVGKYDRARRTRPDRQL